MFGHGQHQAAGLVAHEAFRQAADPRAFPDLALELLAPWESSALYREAWFRPEAATLTLEAGILDWLSGRTLAQLAAASRSMHRSQDMGRLQEIGPRPVRLTWVAGSGGAEARDLFAGIDTSLAAIAPPGSLPRLPAQGPHPLARVEELARAARRAAGEKGVVQAREVLAARGRAEEAPALVTRAGEVLPRIKERVK